MNDIIIIGGPTASGKTGLSLKISKFFKSEIISADSMQIYKYMDIGSAKPSLKERQLANHHMIDIVSPDVDYDVMQYSESAWSIAKDSICKGKVPIIVGGTGFYIESLLYKLPNIKNFPQIREKINNIFNEKGGDYLYDMLLKEWPERCDKIHGNDIKRVKRSLEIALSGQKDEFYKKREKRDCRELFIYLEPDKELLIQRISDRVDIMLKNGLVEEVEYIKRNIGFSRQASLGIGYKETLDYINGDYKNLKELSDKIKLHTIQFVKRQNTFFKNKFKKMIFLDICDINNYKIENIIEKFLEGKNVK